jgi:hypothetical protein
MVFQACPVGWTTGTPQYKVAPFVVGPTVIRTFRVLLGVSGKLGTIVPAGGAVVPPDPCYPPMKVYLAGT